MEKYITAKIKDVCTIKSGKTIPKTMELNKGNIAYVKVADMNICGNEKYITTSSKYVDIDEKSKDIFPIGTVIFPKRGGAIGTNKKRLTKRPICADLNIMGIIPGKKILSEYLFAYFNGVNLEALSNGSSVPQINNCDIAPLDIPVPSKLIQQQISNTLNKAQELIDIRKKQILLCDELVKSQFIEMFGNDFRNNINAHQLKDICSFIDYRGKTPEKSEAGIPLITAKNVKSNAFSIEPQEFIPEENYESVMVRGFPRINDILFTTEAPLGNVCRIPNVYEKFCVGQRLITIQPNKDILTSEYVERALLSQEFQDEMWKRSSGSTVKGIRSKELVLLTIPVPPIEKQKQFTSFVHQVDKLKFGMEQSLKELEDNFDSLMQRAFKGELF